MDKTNPNTHALRSQQSFWLVFGKNPLEPPAGILCKNWAMKEAVGEVVGVSLVTWKLSQWPSIVIPAPF